MRILGIDPGAGGAVALVAQRRLVGVHDMPTLTLKGSMRRRIDAAALASLVQSLGRIDLGVVELVGPMPRDGSAGSFWFGKSAGVAEGVLAGLGIECSTVSPVAWKRRLDVPAAKDKAVARATQLFGDASLWPLKKHHGRAEAAMIALWGWMDRVAGNW